MTKKDYILKVLELLKDDWEPARWLWIVIWELDDEKLLESMYNLFKKWIKNIFDKKVQKKIQESFDYMHKIRNKEQEEYKANEKELDVLEHELDNLF